MREAGRPAACGVAGEPLRLRLGGMGAQPASGGYSSERDRLRPSHADPVDLHTHRDRRVRCDVLFHRLSPKIARSPGEPLSPQHFRRNRLDGDPLHHSRGHGDPVHYHPDRDGRHQRSGHDAQGDRLPVEVALRLSRRRSHLLQQSRAGKPPGHLRGRRPREAGRHVPVGSGQPGGASYRQEGAHPAHRG